MDIDDDDDFYVPDEPKTETAAPEDKKPKADDLEEGEEEDEGAAMDEDDDSDEDDSDIDIITERKDGTKPAPPQQSKYSDIRNIPQRTASSDVPTQPAPARKDSESRPSVNVAAPSADKTSAAASKSTIDVNANPIHPGTGKPITQVNIDEDLPDSDKPWRKPGTDISDYFNYGFDEFTWALYASKQETVRGEFGADVFAQNNKKMMEDFNMMMMGGMGMPGGGNSGAQQGGMPGGMDGMPPEMQAMMQQMMASGMDPSQMDPSQMNAMFSGMQNAGGAGAQGAQGGHAIIGTPEFGLTVEQRKRVTIGVELAAKPELMLFLDEPTSGLDSQSAFNIVRFLKKLAASGQAILCTIHQPNAALFENFDRLLLLQRGGRTVYFGDIGKDAHVLRSYLKSHGAEAGPTDNVAEYMLEAIGAGSAPRVGDRDWADIWEDSAEFADVKETIIRLKRERQAAGATVTVNDPELEKEYASPFKHQMMVVCKRMFLSFWRSPDYIFTRIFSHVAVALITGLMYLNLDNSRASLQNRVFIMFQVTVLPALIITQVEVMFHIKRALFFREQSSKMYSPFVFSSSVVLAELPYSIMCAVAFYLPIYYMPGFQTESSRAGFQFFIILITELFSVTLGQALASITPSPFISAQFDPFIIINFALFCGVTIPKPQIPGFWRAWMYQLDPFTRLISSMVTTALHGVEVVCKQSELNRFSSPPNSTCGEYMEPFFANGGRGYLVNDNTRDCEYCAYKVGDEFYSTFDLSFNNRWRDLGIFACFIASNLIIIILASRFLNFNRR